MIESAIKKFSLSERGFAEVTAFELAAIKFAAAKEISVKAQTKELVPKDIRLQNGRFRFCTTRFHGQKFACADVRDWLQSNAAVLPAPVVEFKHWNLDWL